MKVNNIKPTYNKFLLATFDDLSIFQLRFWNLSGIFFPYFGSKEFQEFYWKIFVFSFGY